MECDNSSTEGSHGVTEEDVIDTLFFTCDTGKTGKVPVSTLIQYLVDTCDDNSEWKKLNIQDLQRRLDPSDADVAVDLITYRKEITNWIENIRSSPECDSGGSETTDIPSALHTPSESPVFSKHAPTSPSSNRELYSSELAHLDYRRMPSAVFDSGYVELQQRVSALMYNNKKLMGENYQLKMQVEVSEETVSQLNAKVDDLTKSMKSLQQTADRLVEVRDENCDLKSALSTVTESKKQLELLMKEYEKKCHVLGHQADQLQMEVMDAATQLEDARKENRRLHKDEVQHKEWIQETERILENHNSMMLHKNKEIREMRVTVDEFNRVNENIRREKTELELELASTQHALNCALSPKIERKDKGRHTNDDDEGPIPFVITSYDSPPKAASLGAELKNSIQEAPDLPSPITVKERERILRQNNVPDSYEEHHEVSSTSQIDLNERGDINQEPDFLTKNKVEILELLSKLSTPKDENENKMEVQMATIRDKLEQEVHKFSNKIASLVVDKKKDDIRIEKLSSSVKKLKEKNRNLKSENSGLVQEIRQQSKASNAEKITQLEKILKEEKALKAKLEKQLNDTQSKLSTLQTKSEKLSCGLVNLEVANTKLQLTIQELESANALLSEKNMKSEEELKATSLELENTRKSYNTELDRNAQLEENLLSTEMSRQLDMRDLWRLVQKDIEDEYQDSDPGHDTPITVSADSLRDQVAKEIHSLRSQLARSQKTLTILQNRSLPLKSTTKHKHYDWRNNNPDDSPSSPLVDALTIDFFEHESQYRRHTDKPGGGSADNILDFDDNKNICDNDSSSCPHLLRSNNSPRVKHIALPCIGAPPERTQSTKRRPPQLGTSKYNPVNTSTGSSTSGVDVSSDIHPLPPPYSHHQQQHREKKVQIIETACSPGESDPEDPDNPLYRYRSPSFKRAIERGHSADSNQSAETVDPASTSPDITPDRSDFPPYPGTCEYQARTYTTGSNYLAPPLHQEYVVNYLHSADRAVNSDNSSVSGLAPYPSAALQPHPIASKLSSDYPLPKGGPRLEYTADIHGDLGMDIQGQLTAAEIDISRLSPSTQRRLSTLPEEEDAEVDENHHHKGGPIPPPRNSRSKSKSPTPPRSPNPQSTDHKSSDGHQSGERKSSSGDGDTGLKPPGYKSPPHYKDVMLSRSRDNSPNPENRLEDSPPQRQHTQHDSSNLPPYRKPTEPPSYNATIAHKATKNTSLSQSQDSETRDDSKDRSFSIATDGSLDSHDSEKVSKTGRERRKSLTESRKNSRSSFMSVGKDGEVVDLLNSELGEVDISEEDKRLNEQILEEARKASQTSKHRFKKHRGSTLSDSSQDLNRSASIDDGGVSSEEVFSNQPQVSTDTSGVSSTVPPDTTRQLPNQPIQEEHEEVEDIKAVIMQGVEEIAKSDTAPTLKVTVPGPKAELNKIREENLAKKRGGGLTKQLKMPDLTEAPAEDSSKPTTSSTDATDRVTPPPAPSTAPVPSNALAVPVMNGHGPVGESPVYPSLSDKVLAKMGLLRKQGDNLGSDQFSDQECEEKFATISLSFKTDKLTLDKRMDLHRRARDIAEQNIERELSGLKEAIKSFEFLIEFTSSLGHICTETKSRELYTKVQSHLEVLEESTSRMSSRAEVHGAVQQEHRTNKAIEVMVTHVENLKRVYEKEHHELEETRKLIQENKLPDSDALNKRSMSVAAGLGTRGGRRRASVAAFPRAHPNSISPLPLDKDSNKSKFLGLMDSAASSVTSMVRRSSIATPPSPFGVLRRASLAVPALSSFNFAAESASLRSKKLSKDDSDTILSKTPLISEDPKTDSDEEKEKQKNTEEEKIKEDDKISKDANGNIQTEDLYQKGFEEGIKATMTHELEDLQENQRLFQDHIDRLLDESEELEDEDEEEIEPFAHKILRMIVEWQASTQKSGIKIRYTLGVLLFMMGIVTLLFTFIPSGKASHYSGRLWTGTDHILWPYGKVHRYEQPPW